MNPHQLRLPPPHPGSNTTRSYRPPRPVIYHDDEDDEFWNVTSSEGEPPHHETAPGRRRPSTREVVINPKASSRSSRRRPTQQHRRDPPLELAYHNEEYPGPSMASGPDRPPRPGGDVYHLPQPDSRRHANPFAPLNRPPPQSQHASYDRNYEQYHTMHQPGHPAMSPPFGGPPPLYGTPPTDSYLSGQGPYPMDPHGGGYYPRQPPPPNMYPGHPGFGGSGPYAHPPPIIPVYDEEPHRDAHIAEMERLERQARKLEIRERDLEVREREEEAARRRQEAADKAERRERRRNKEQEKSRQVEIQRRRELEIRRETEARILASRQPVEAEVQDGVSGKKIDKEVKAAMDYIAAKVPKREIAGRNGGPEGEEFEDTGDILVAIKQFVEDRIQRQERQGLEERSMKSAKSGKSTGTARTARTARKLEIVPFEQEVDLVTRTQIETIVIDVLKRVGMPALAEQSPEWGTTTFASAKPLSLRSPGHGYDAHYGELETRPAPEHHDSYEKQQLDPRTPDSQGRFSDRTAVDTSHQYHPLEIDRGTVRLRNPPGTRKAVERKRESDTTALRVRNAAPRNDYFTELHDQSAEEEYSRPVPKRSERKDGTGNDRLKKRPEKDQKRRKRRDNVPSDSDETDEMYSRREGGQYAGKPPRGSRQERVVIPPPTVPDAPQGETIPSHQASVATDAEDP